MSIFHFVVRFLLILLGSLIFSSPQLNTFLLIWLGLDFLLLYFFVHFCFLYFRFFFLFDFIGFSHVHFFFSNDFTDFQLTISFFFLSLNSLRPLFGRRSYITIGQRFYRCSLNIFENILKLVNQKESLVVNEYRKHTFLSQLYFYLHLFLSLSLPKKKITQILSNLKCFFTLWDVEMRILFTPSTERFLAGCCIKKIWKKLIKLIKKYKKKRGKTMKYKQK